ncbi:MAG: hypothetical protein R6V45_13310, partial [Oceanipulchritudo sp.]
PVARIDEDDYRFAIGETEVILELWDDNLVLTIGEAIRVTGELEFADDDDQDAGLLYELEAESIRDLDDNLIAEDDEAFRDDDDDVDGDDSHSEPLSLDDAIDRLQEGWDDVTISVEGTPVARIDEDDYRFAIGETEVILELWDDNLVLTIGEAIRVTGELEYADDDDQAAGLLYELEAEIIRDLDDNLIAEDDEAFRDDDDDDDGDDSHSEPLSLDDAIDRLQQGWDDATISVEGTPVALIDEDDYRFAIGETEVILELWDDDIVLTIGEAIRVTGELEYADDDDQATGLLYELDAMWIEDLAGNRLGDDDDAEDDREDDDLEERYGNRAEGTLAELVDLLESRQDDDLNVRTSGTLGERVGDLDDDDGDYLFSDDSGVTVILDLDSRAELSFALTPGMELEIIGELERVDDDDEIPAGITHELDAVWIRLADGTSLDIGQLTPFAGSTISDWIGYFWKLDDDGWYYHPSKGLLFSEDTLDDDDWFLSLNREDWIYVSRESYPLIFSNSGGWHYLIGSAYGELQHGYSYDEDEWILDFWREGP